MARRTPRYVEIAADLQARIDDGRLEPGDRLPTEKELAQRWGVSENTIKAAVNELRKGAASRPSPEGQLRHRTRYALRHHPELHGPR